MNLITTLHDTNTSHHLSKKKKKKKKKEKKRKVTSPTIPQNQKIGVPLPFLSPITFKKENPINVLFYDFFSALDIEGYKWLLIRVLKIYVQFNGIKEYSIENYILISFILFTAMWCDIIY